VEAGLLNPLKNFEEIAETSTADLFDINLKEAARLASVDHHTFDRWWQSGIMVGVERMKVRGSIRFKSKQVLSFIAMYTSVSTFDGRRIE
jgi:hypothetical protein